MRPTPLSLVLTLVACSCVMPLPHARSQSGRVPRITVQPAPRPAPRSTPVASQDPIRTLTGPKRGAFILGVSNARPVVFSFQETIRDGRIPETTIVTTDLVTGATIDSWTSSVLSDLAMSPWTDRRTTKSKRSELDFDLAGRLDEVRAELAPFRDRLLEAGRYRLVGSTPKLAVSRDGKQLVFNGGDLLFYLGAGQPVLLENDASYDPVVSPDGMRVAYRTCPSPCSGRYTLRIATLSDNPSPQKVDSVVLSEAVFWSEDGGYLYAVTDEHCAVRVDARSLAMTKLVCEVEAMSHDRHADTLAALVYENGRRELRMLALPDGKTTYRAVLDSKITNGAHNLALDAPIAVSSGGQVLLSLTGSPREAPEIHVVDRKTARQRRFARSDLDCSDLVWGDAHTVVGLCRGAVTLFDFAALLAGP